MGFVDCCLTYCLDAVWVFSASVVAGRRWFVFLVFGVVACYDMDCVFMAWACGGCSAVVGLMMW